MKVVVLIAILVLPGNQSHPLYQALPPGWTVDDCEALVEDYRFLDGIEVHDYRCSVGEKTK